MPTFTELEALTGSVKPIIPLPETRFDGHWTDVTLPPPYTSLFDDVQRDIDIHLRNNKIRQNALHPVYLQAGQSPLPNGEFGRPAARHPVLLPELLGGRILYTNI